MPKSAPVAGTFGTLMVGFRRAPGGRAGEPKEALETPKKRHGKPGVKQYLGPQTSL